MRRAIGCASRRFGVVTLCLIVSVVGLAGVSGSAVAAAGGPLTSDDFHEGINSSLWTIVNPSDEGAVSVVGAGTSDVGVALALPGGGAAHDAWNIDDSLRLMQSVADDDFTTEVKFTTVPSERFQTEGLIFEQDEHTWLRFDVHHDGSLLQGFVSRTSNDASTKLAQKSVVPGAAVYLRVARAGSKWTFSYSSNGSSWGTVASVTSSLTLAKVGPFAANSGDPVPAWTADVDYVFNTASPISPEDGAQPSQAPPTISIWYGDDQTFGQNGEPQEWVNILGNVSAPAGLASLTYSLNGAAPVNLSVGPDNRRLVDPGDFNADIGYDALSAGSNTVTLVATDNVGQIATHVVTVHKVAGSATTPYDTAWSTRSAISDAAQIVDGKWALEGGVVRNTQLGYDRTIALGDIHWSNYEVTIPFTLNGIDDTWNTPESVAPALGVGIYWLGHTPRVAGEQPNEYWYPTGAFAWYQIRSTTRFELDGNNGSPVVRKNVSLSYGTPYIWKIRAQAVSGGVQYSFKAWPASQSEPANWTLQIVGTTGPTAGGIILVAHHVDVSFGDITVNAVGTSPSSPPVSTSPPVVSGVAQVGQSVSVSTGSWSNGPSSYAYQWNRCGSSCAPISGATQATYAVASGDVGSTLTATVTASNSAGAGAPATSAPTAVVTDGSSGGDGGTTTVLAAGRADTNLATESRWPGAEDPPYVCCWGQQGQYVTFSFDSAGGATGLALRYSAGGGTATRRIDVDGATLVANQAFPATSGWGAWSTVMLSPALAAGSHTLKVWFDAASGSSRYLNLDNLTVTS